MNRSARRHRSTKIPNVKLRPVPAAAASAPGGEGRRATSRHAEQHPYGGGNAARPSAPHAGEGGEEEEEAAAMAHYRALRQDYMEGKRKEAGRAARAIDSGSGIRSLDDDDNEDNEDAEDRDDAPPFAGLVLCLSGIGEDKGHLTDVARSLGAVVEANLTESATHLIAHQAGSVKYTSALHVGIPIMRPSWLEEVRERWTGAQHVDFDSLADQHRLAPLDGVVLGLAGITDSSKRREIRAKVQGASGATPIAFRLDGTFTHLVCEDTKSSETLKVVYKYRKRAERFLRRGESVPEGEANAVEMNAAIKIKLVRLAWLEDSFQVGGCLPDKHYGISEPVLPVEQRKDFVEAVLRQKETRHQALLAARQSVNEKIRRRLAKDTLPSHGKPDEDNQKPRKALKRPHMQIGQLVQHLNRSSSEEAAAKETQPLAWEEPQTDRDSGCDVEPMHKRKKESQLVKNGTDAARDVPSHTTETRPPEEENPNNIEALEEEERAGLALYPCEKSLSEIAFRIDLHHDAKNDAVRRALQKIGATKMLAPEDRSQAHFHVLPLSAPSVATDKHLGIPVTHFFVERCLLEGRLLGLHESFALQPSPHTFPLSGVENILIATTGLGSEGEGPDRHQMEKALEAAGIKTESILKRGRHTHLLCGREAQDTPNSQAKIEKARKWGLPIVQFDFVDRLYKSGLVSPTPARSSTQNYSARQILAYGVREDASSISQDANATVGETQDVRGFLHDAADFTSNGQTSMPKSHQPVARSPQNNARPWQRSTSGSQAHLDGEETRGFDVAARRARDARITASDEQSFGEDIESMGAGTLAINSSAADEVMALLESRSSQTGTSFSKGATGSNNAGRKYRRLPPSMRPGFRRTSRTPVQDEGIHAEAGRDKGRESASPPLDTAELLLSKGREEEALRHLNGTSGTQLQSLGSSTSSDPYGALQGMSHHLGADNEESLRVVYEDPAARRERRKMADIIDMAKSKRRQQEQLEQDRRQQKDAAGINRRRAGDRSSSTEADGEESAALDTSAAGRQGRVPEKMDTYPPNPAFSPSIKARKQPGTAVHM